MPWQVDDVAGLVTAYPLVLTYSPENEILPTVEFIREELGIIDTGGPTRLEITPCNPLLTLCVATHRVQGARRVFLSMHGLTVGSALGASHATYATRWDIQKRQSRRNQFFYPLTSSSGSGPGLSSCMKKDSFPPSPLSHSSLPRQRRSFAPPLGFRTRRNGPASRRAAARGGAPGCGGGEGGRERAGKWRLSPAPSGVQ